jgi:hypothetical protein
MVRRHLDVAVERAMAAAAAVDVLAPLRRSFPTLGGPTAATTEAIARLKFALEASRSPDRDDGHANASVIGHLSPVSLCCGGDKKQRSGLSTELSTAREPQRLVPTLNRSHRPSQPRVLPHIGLFLVLEWEGSFAIVA